jgi:hypothetical protein
MQFQSGSLYPLGADNGVTNKREHHEIPRFYLSGFAKPDSSFVWAYRRGRSYSPGKKKGRDNPYLAGLGVTTTKRDRYTVVDLNGARHFNLIEDMMREWEEFGRPAITRIRQGQTPRSEEKERLSRYIGCMWKRVEKRERSATEIYQRELEKWRALPRGLADLGLFKLALKAEGAMDYLRSDRGRKYTLLRAAVDPLHHMHEGLMTMRWHILRAPTATYFVTSDAPVVFDEIGGLRRSSLGFPLSSHAALLANWTEGEDLVEIAATPSQVRSFNEAVINAAHQEVYAPFDHKWICDALGDRLPFSNT